MDQVIIFDKSLQQRLQEYKDVLSGYEVLPVSIISKEWSYYLEFTVDPIGWQAIWKIPRITCESLKIPFPSIVLVFVLEIDFKDLLAMVRVLAVQDDIHIPDKHYVSLMQLWPTKDQDKSVALNLTSTANSLDMLRFFYTHIFMPWDRDDEDTTDWKRKHLESRLRLYYDMKNGIIPRATGEHLHSLLTEARRLQTKRDLLEGELSDDEDADIDAGNVNNKKVEALMELHVRLMEIRSEVEILENPMLRNVVIRKQNELMSAKASKNQHIWLIFNEGKVEDYIDFLQKVKKDFPNETLTFASSLASKLETANSNDVFILNETSHSIRTTGALENGGILKGIGDRKRTIITSSIDDVMLDFIGETVLIENLTVDATLAQCAILVRRGKGILRNCKIVGDGSSSTHQGIIVLAGAELELIDCDVSGFSTAIVGNSGSKIKLERSEVHDVNIGLKIYDKCVVNAQKSTFRDCQNYGVVVETESSVETNQKKVGSFDTLDIIPDVKTELVSGKNNGKGDVVINQKCRIIPVDDLFKDNLDPTIIGDSDEDMETTDSNDLNSTVVDRRNVSPLTI